MASAFRRPSLLRARTIGQIRTLIAEHMGASVAPAAKPGAPVAKATSIDEVDLDALSDDEIGSLLDENATSNPPEFNALCPRIIAHDLSNGWTVAKPVSSRLTLSQRELWEASPVPVADVSNHICTFMEVRSALSQQDCEAAMQRVVDRQEVLRLSILPGKNGPLQLIRRTAVPAMQFRELTAAQSQPEALEEHMRGIFEKPFDLLRGPLYRVEVLRRGPDDLILVFAIHHAIADGWTLGVFVQDIFTSYLLGAMGASGTLQPVPLSYADWGAAERASWPAAKLEDHARFWKSQLAGAPRLWNSPGGNASRDGSSARCPLFPWMLPPPCVISPAVRMPRFSARC